MVIQSNNQFGCSQVNDHYQKGAISMNKTQMDIQLIEACILEKWNPIAMGCKIDQTSRNSCCLCQVYWDDFCENCPICIVSSDHCGNKEFQKYVKCIENSSEEYDSIEEEIEFLINLLPPNHPWRNI